MLQFVSVLTHPRVHAGTLPMSITKEEGEEPVLGNGDTLSERLEAIDIEEDDTCTIEELQEKLDL
jgi:hypothetical protein